MFDFEATPAHWVNRLSFQLRSRAAEGFAAAGIDLSAEEWALLMVLWGRGPQRMTALATLTLRDRTTVTRMIDRLARKGLVERRAQPGDRRAVTIAPTAQAQALQAPVMEVISPLIARAMEGIAPDDQARALDVLRRMSANLEAGPDGAA